MREKRVGKGLIVQLPPSETHKVSIDGGKTVNVYRLNGVYIEFSGGESNTAKFGATGTGVTEDAAWNNVVSIIEQQISSQN